MPTWEIRASVDRPLAAPDERPLLGRAFWVAAGALVALVALGLILAGTAGDDGEDVGTAGAGRSRVEGFGEVAFRVGSDASVRCALLAETSSQHARGLMGRTDLAGYDGMLFRFDVNTMASFYMKNTPLPLSIAWFDADGRFVSAADMEPCVGRRNCQFYSAAGPYRYALEVPQGELSGLGIGPGSRIEVGGRCPR